MFPSNRNLTVMLSCSEIILHTKENEYSHSFSFTQCLARNTVTRYGLAPYTSLEICLSTSKLAKANFSACALLIASLNFDLSASTETYHIISESNSLYLSVVSSPHTIVLVFILYLPCFYHVNELSTLFF